MLVCHCKGLSERDVVCAIRSGAGSRHEVGRACGAGTVCGGCRPSIEQLVEAHAASAEPPELRLGFELSAAS
jgi:assimilatory nitrate reductase catalytic subunit